MFSAIAGAAVLSLAASLAPARVTSPLGRAPKPQHGLQAPRMWQDRTGQFALERPAQERWMLRSGVRGPDGEAVPLLALSQETGAQLIVQADSRDEAIEKGRRVLAAAAAQAGLPAGPVVRAEATSEADEDSADEDGADEDGAAG